VLADKHAAAAADLVRSVGFSAAPLGVAGESDDSEPGDPEDDCSKGCDIAVRLRGFEWAFLAECACVNTMTERTA
jgi:hypothetical protein